jgi:hypothetical protein
MLRWCASIPGDEAKQYLEGYKAALIEIRTAIRREIKKSQAEGEVKVRPEFERIVDTLLMPHSQSFMLVTTNWDTVVPDALRNHLNRTMDGFLLPLPIHGSIKRQDTLYLPTEVTREPYRSADKDSWLGGLNTAIMQGLKAAQRCVIYGLSLSPLDAELGQTLAAGWNNPNLEEVIVVVPDHELVTHRVNLLLDHTRRIVVKGYAPTDLKNFTDYTIEPIAERKVQSR